MFNINKSHLIKELAIGEKLSIIFMAHNAYWGQIEQLDMCYQNCKVQTFGRGTAYLKMSPKQEIMDDPDLILFYSGKYDEIELEKMNKLAETISNKKAKRVSIGYSYQTEKELEYEVKFVSYKDGIMSEETIDEIGKYFSPLELAEYTFVEHDNLNNSKKINKKLIKSNLK